MIYKTSGVCCSEINLDIENDIIKEVNFVGGCAGNTFGISKLVAGMPVDEVITRLEGVTCGHKASSCPDQLAKALKQFKGE